MVSYLNIIYIKKERIPRFSLSLEGCEVKEIAEAAKVLVEEMNDLIGNLKPGSCDLMEAEQRVYEGVQSIAQKL